MKTGRYSLYQLLNNPEIEQIIIPEIQRDYVWQKQNTIALLDSIKMKYKEKKSINLSIKVNEQHISQSMNSYLTKEYEKIMYCTKIGFIYAYHDPNYPGKFFLIDGQQRITTLYLLLIALYKKQPERWTDFRERYFAQQLPKLDYRVREITHDFLIQLIEHELSSHNTVAFNKSVNYYDIIYDKDITTKNLWNNYVEISTYINKHFHEELNIFTDYLEHFVEFNFFDTNISAQGERLYLYMNSRGEDLSYQETIKSLIISKSNNKQKDGLDWEEWQDFFWNNRRDNINADQGFQNFLKWSVVLHIVDSETAKMKNARVLKSGKTQTGTEIIEDYIKVLKDSNTKSEDEYHYSAQYKDIRIYIKENESFNNDWLSKVMAAIRILKEKQPDNLFINKKWLCQETSTNDYIVLLPIIYFLIRFPEAKDINIKRLAYLLKNKTYESTHFKNPDRAVYQFLNLVKQMEDEDILKINCEQHKNIFVNIEQIIFKKLLDDVNNRRFWDFVLGRFINSEKIERFLQGNCSCIWNISENNPRIFLNYLTKFEESVLNKKDKESDSRELRRQLLSYGDYCIDERGGSANLTDQKLGRYNFISSDDDWRKKLNENEFIKTHLKPLLDNEEPSAKNHEKWMQPFLNDKDLFIGAYKFLWQDSKVSPRIILLDATQAGENKSWHIENIILRNKWNTKHNYGAWNWNYKTTVIPFMVNDKNAIEYIKEDRKDPINYYIDVIFEWNVDGESQWYVIVGKRNYQNLHIQENYTKFEDFELIEGSKYKYSPPIHIHDINKSINDNIENLCNQLQTFIEKQLKEKIMDLFPDYPEDIL